MRIFIVRRGDSLYSVARRFGVSVTELARINELSAPDRLSVGQALVIPDGATPDSEIEVNGYAYPGIGGEVLRRSLPSLTFLCPFSWQANADGSLNPIDDQRLIDAAKDSATAPLLTVTNIGSAGGFSSDIAHSLLTNPDVTQRFIENIVTELRQKKYYGLNLNFEYLYPFDREAYNDFLRRISETLHPLGYYLSSAIAPKTSDTQQGVLYSAHDYAAHGKYCDRVVIMTYEWGYTYSSPRAVSPVDRIREVLDYAVTRIDPGKILMGFSNYGYNWRLPWKQGEAAQVISNAAAARLAASVFAEIHFDPNAEASYFNYTDPTGIRREVWFEDARSIAARLKLVSEYGLAGISYWTLDQLGVTGLYILNSMYNTEKIL